MRNCTPFKTKNWVLSLFFLALLLAPLPVFARRSAPPVLATASHPLKNLQDQYQAEREKYEAMVKGGTATREELEKQQQLLAGLQIKIRSVRYIPNPTTVKRDSAPVKESVSETLSVPPSQPTTEHSLGYSGIPWPDEGNNYCGQYAMTTILQGMGHTDFKFDDVYRDTNPHGIFSAPGTLVDYLNKKGIGAQQHQGGSIEDLKKQLDAKKPVMVLVDAGGTPHWVAITGYKTDPAGNITQWEMMDSYWGISQPGRKAYKTHDEFLKMWKSPLSDGFLGKMAGYSNLWIAIGEKKTYPLNQPFSVAYADLAASAINNVVTGWTNKNFWTLGRGVVEGLFTIPSAIVAGVGRGVELGGDWMVKKGKEWMQGGIAGKVGGGLMWLGGQGVRLGGTVVKSVGNGLATIGKGAGYLIEGAGSLLKKIF